MPKGYSQRNQSGWKHNPSVAIRVSLAMNERGGQFGEKNPNWKGGVTKTKNMIRKSKRYNKWRNNRYIIDNYVCQVCFKRGGNLEVDHFPKTFKEILKEYNIKTYKQSLSCEILWDVNNGRTLCKKCHYNYHYKI